FFFFFQAEDGIRDFHVTGVQTCALPISANCIAPGFIKTAMTDVLTEKQVEAIAQHIPAAKFGEPDDIAAAALYLASEEARYMTGQTLHVNGGMAMICS